jgi:2-polyprenyl-6-methoxyphenol hydroxylase-like FAD-dependent oxidoreductase
VNREKLRGVLLKGIAEHVQWSKRLTTFESKEGRVEAIFDDGTSAFGSLIIGAEGSNSAVRRSLSPHDYRNRQLPIRFVGVGAELPAYQVEPLRDLDPLLFQGCHPESGCFLWVSMLEVPSVNGSAGTDHEHYRVQFAMSWPVRSEADEIKPDKRAVVENMKERSSIFAPVLRDAVASIPDDADVLEIKLADWPCREWDNRDGKATLIGDAAHAMTMYRGEAANHGLLDAYYLWQTLKRIHAGELPQREAIDIFEEEMRRRTGHAVQMSRQACFDAHDFSRLDENSAILAKRAIFVDVDGER